MSTRKQCIVGVAATLGAISSGMGLGFSAVALPAMQSPDHVPQVSDEKASWIASLASIGMPIGCLVMGTFLDALGRRKTLMLVNIPGLIGWILILATPSSEPWFYYQMYVGRFFVGLTIGLVASPAIVYASEMMEKMLRGIMVAWPSIGVSLGTVSVYLLGAIFKENWRLVAGICGLFPAISIASVWFLVPESAVWLVTRGRIQEAEMSLRRVRNIPFEEELPESLYQELEEMKAKEIKVDEEETDWKDTVRFLKKPEAYKPLLIFNALFFFQQFSGIYVIIFYSVMMVRDLGVSFDSYVSSVLIGAARLIMSIFTSYASKQWGRRQLCMASGLGMTFSIGSLALFLTLKEDGVIKADGSWFPVVALFSFILTSTCGFLNLPFAMLGEVFPTRIRGNACSFCTAFAATLVFLAVKLFPDMRNAWGYRNILIFYTAVIATGTVVMYFFLPETRNKTLAEIEEWFRSGKKGQKKNNTSDKLLKVDEVNKFASTLTI